MKKNAYAEIAVALAIVMVVAAAVFVLSFSGNSSLKSSPSYVTVTSGDYTEDNPESFIFSNNSLNISGSGEGIFLENSPAKVVVHILNSQKFNDSFNESGHKYDGGLDLYTVPLVDVSVRGDESLLNSSWAEIWYSENSGFFYFALIISFVMSAVLSIIPNRHEKGWFFGDPAKKILIAGGNILIASLMCLISSGLIESSYSIFELSEQGLFICAGLIFTLIYAAASSILFFGLTIASGKTGYSPHAHFLSLAGAGIFYALCLSSENPALYGMNLVYIPLLLVLSALLVLVPRFVPVFSSGKSTNAANFEKGDNTLVFDSGENTPEERQPLFPKELYKNYSDVSIAGAGGIAIVFHAKRKEDGRDVAVKVPISRDELTGRSFIREIGVWEKLRHKNIVEVYSANILPVPYIEMEYIEKNISDLLAHIPVLYAFEIMCGILEGLSYAHKKEIVHHDIKPANVLIDSDSTPKLTDWGLCRSASDNFECSGMGFSFFYAAPEQIFPMKYGRPGKKTDIYQAGLLFYEILTGRKVHTGDIIGKFFSEDEKEEIKPVSSVLSDDSLKPADKIIRKCLEKDPLLRYDDIESLLEDIRSLYICLKGDKDKEKTGKNKKKN
ncbi:hypothetical protein J2128_002110 [Methanomicrobium sp. W14]|uniref:serine/threonine-protein kinase n=1 Tax=Methanomicrobium sp. W14 TaxID=2817839 RepID=UPI001AE178EE|nr:serine/threonine-protein kinase [Methanomicrobium sp. W14]MBP2134144.1 hypothetical protein [Methanomicrobium sp. W14]